MLVERRRIVFILSVIFFIAFVGVLDSDVYGAKKTPPGKVKIKSASQTRIPIDKYGEIVGYIKKQSVRLEWRHVKNADGYVVYRKYKKGKYKAIKNIKLKKTKAAGSILECTTPQVKKGKYYFKIAPYKLYAGKRYYGKKSSAKGIYVKPKKAVKRWNIGCGSKSTVYGSAKAKKNVKATLYDNGELIISGKGNAQYARGYVHPDDDGDGYYDGMPWMPRIYGEWIYDYIYKVTIKKGVAPKSIRGWFYDLSRLKKAPQIPSSVKNMDSTFDCCSSLKQAPKIPSGVRYMRFTFRCSSLKQAPKIPSSVRDMGYTFCCTSLKQAPKIPSGVKYMNGTFERCRALRRAPQISSGVKDMVGAFQDCKSLKQAPKIPSSVKDMRSTFEGCKSLKQAPKIPVGVKDMKSTFEGCESLVKGPSSIPSSVKDMTETFRDCKSLKQAPKISSGVKNMDSTFDGCSSLKQAPKIPVGVKDMNDTFYKCKSLKQAPEIPAGVKNMHGTFFDCESLVKGPSSIPSSVENMDATFRYCKSMTGTIKIKTTLANVTDEDSSYSHCEDCFKGAATDDGCQIRLDYVDEALVDKILEDVSSESHVVKGNYIG